MALFVSREIKKMKIYIVGTVASGKSTLAKGLSKQLQCPYFSLDDIVHKSKKDGYGNEKRSVAERDEIFQEILKRENYIIEDVGRDCFSNAYEQVDQIICLDFPLYFLRTRIVFRFLKQKLVIEKASYNVDFRMLRMMFKWVKVSPLDKLQGNSKLIVLKNKAQVKAYLKQFS